MMPELKPHQIIIAALGWSVLMFSAGFIGGYVAGDPDCATCETALSTAIDELHSCQRKSLTPDPAECEDARAQERASCQKTLTQYRALRCRICEAQDDLDRIKSAQPTQPH
jgi:hypothetical protein